MRLHLMDTRALAVRPHIAVPISRTLCLVSCVSCTTFSAGDPRKGFLQRYRAPATTHEYRAEAHRFVFQSESRLFRDGLFVDCRLPFAALQQVSGSGTFIQSLQGGHTARTGRGKTVTYTVCNHTHHDASKYLDKNLRAFERRVPFTCTPSP